jgi:peptide/nickel transport system substrate-binding protein
MYREMQRILRDEGGVIVPMFANAVVARNEAITHGEHVSAVRPFDGRRIIERWWLA